MAHPSTPHVLAVLNHKGGVGKTTTTLNLGRALSQAGQRVLIVDIDPQSNLSQSLGVEEPDPSLYTTLVEDAPLPIHQHDARFHLVPAELGLSGAEMKLQAEHVTGYFKLNNGLQQVANQYDYVLIDCPPSLGILTINALVAAKGVLIVVEPQYLAVKGLQTILELIEKIKTTIKPDLAIRGMLFTRFNRTVISKSIIEQLQAEYGPAIYQTIIRQNVRLAEASAMRQDIFAYDPESAGAEDYRALAREVLQRDGMPVPAA